MTIPRKISSCLFLFWMSLFAMALTAQEPCRQPNKTSGQHTSELQLAEVSGEKRYDEVTWLCTHNAMSNSADGWKLCNQNLNLAAQFKLGVRAFMLDLHPQDGKIVLRHGPAIARVLGSKPLADELPTFVKMLETNEDAVITLILESYVPAADVAKLFDTAGLSKYAYAHEVGKAWPTVGKLRSAGLRLVVLSDNATGGPAWMHPVWEHAFETPFSASKPADLKNVLGRGKQTQPLFILNHFCADPLPSAKIAEQINSAAFLQDRLAAVNKTFGRPPTFVAIDFCDLGDAAKVLGCPKTAASK